MMFSDKLLEGLDSVVLDLFSLPVIRDGRLNGTHP